MHALYALRFVLFFMSQPQDKIHNSCINNVAKRCLFAAINLQKLVHEAVLT